MAGPYDANSVGIGYKAQTDFDTVLSTGAETLTALRMNSESFQQEVDTIVSEELRSDRARADLIRTGVRVTGGFDFEFSAATNSSAPALDDWMAAAMYHSTTWATTGYADPDSSAISGGCTIHARSGTTPARFERDSGSWTNTPVIGQVITLANSASNDGNYTVVGADSNTIWVAETMTAEATQADLTLVDAGGDYVENGTTFTYFGVERFYTNPAGSAEGHVTYDSCTVDTWSMNFEVGSIVTGSFGVLGSAMRDVQVSTGSYTAAPTEEIFNAISHVDGVFLWDGTSSKRLTNLTQFSFDLANNARARQEIGSVAATSMGTGSFDITGSLSQYYDTDEDDAFTAFVNDTPLDIVFCVTSPAGDKYNWHFPQVKTSSGQRVAGGINTDVISQFDFTAYKDDTKTYTMRVSRKV